jgi:hypothetical protein
MEQSGEGKNRIKESKLACFKSMAGALRQKSSAGKEFCVTCIKLTVRAGATNYLKIFHY